MQIIIMSNIGTNSTMESYY